MQNSKLQIKNTRALEFLHFALSFSILIFTFWIFPSLVSASSVYIDSNHSEFFVGDTIIFNIRIDSEDKNINTIEGEVLLDHAADMVSLIDINTSGSKFSLWPIKPTPSERNVRISFAGGSLGGFVSSDAIVFNIVLKLQKEGRLALSPHNIGAYLNDGRGTKDKVNIKNLVIDVLPQKPDSQPIDDWSNLTSSDKTPPEPFEIYLGQDGSVFDGKKFLSFSTTDGQSGIKYYEVKEGDLPPTRSNGTYVLQKQDESNKIIIIAYDTSGNGRESVYSPKPVNIYYSVIIIFAILLLLIVFKKKAKNKNDLSKE